jgi:transcriptional repressor NF-X1
MPPQTCFCGKESQLVKCADYDPELLGWSCGQPCSTPLVCNAAEIAMSDGEVERHVCHKPCHQGPCLLCEIRETVPCFCGKHSKEISCSDKEFPKRSESETESWLGFYQCGEICARLVFSRKSNDRKFDCGIHSCEKRCHEQDATSPVCPRSPERVKTCPCGKTPIGDLASRNACQDPIPHCEKPCEKPLPCGHRCQTTCHLEACPPCILPASAKCRCGQTNVNLLCYELGRKELLCEKICTSNKSCGRHHCGTQCCSGDHLCTKVCGRPLKCGSHNCTVLCHRGPCPTCLEASFEPLICTCGRTELAPPIRCGTQPPSCQFQCIIEPACRHPKVVHTCHSPEEACPKCPYLVEKECMCGKRSVKNQPCFRAQAGVVSCGMACGALMPCGFHRCRASWYAMHEMELIIVIDILTRELNVLRNVESLESPVDMPVL